MALIDLTTLIDREKEARNRERWQLLSLSDLTEVLPPIPWLCESVGMAPGAVSLVAGYGYSRKTMALQSMAVSVAAGKRVWGLYACRQGRVLHLDYEQGRRVTQERYQRLARGMGMELGDLPADALRVGSMPKIYLDEDDAPEELMRLCEGVTFVIVDSLRAAFPHADENSSEVRSYLDVLNRVSERTGATIAVIHHARKPSKDNAEGATFAIRGSSALFDACQSVYVFEGAKDTPTRVHHQKDRIRGVTAEEFGLTSEDVSDGVNSRWALRVTHLAEEQMRQAAENEEAAAARAASVRVTEAVREFLGRGPFQGSRSALREACGGRVQHQRFVSALGEMIRSGEVNERGTYHQREFILGVNR